MFFLARYISTLQGKITGRPSNNKKKTTPKNRPILQPKSSQAPTVKNA
jgi:hypothetical protein